jgi:hypothetical protein
MKRQWLAVLALTALALLPGQSHGQYGPAIPIGGGSSVGSGGGPALMYLLSECWESPVGRTVLCIIILLLVVGLILNLCYEVREAAQTADSPASQLLPESRPGSATRIRIIAPPPGEAPEHIRAAWVGLELPLMGGATGPRTLSAAGVLSGKGTVCVLGYVVSGKAAVELLAAHAPDAAAWWRTNAPHVLHDGYPLIFPADVCQKAA